MLLKLNSLFKKSKIKEEVKKEESLFKINFDAKKPILPDVEDETKLDLRYGLIVPYAYAHLYWDDVHKTVSRTNTFY